jgi:hypothetical protein
MIEEMSTPYVFFRKITSSILKNKKDNSLIRKAYRKTRRPFTVLSSRTLFQYLDD